MHISIVSDSYNLIQIIKLIKSKLIIYLFVLITVSLFPDILKLTLLSSLSIKVEVEDILHPTIKIVTTIGKYL